MTRRQLVLVAIVIALILAFTVRLWHGEALPPPPGMTTVTAPAPRR